MIINTGARTDSVACYSKWLLKRFDEGFVYSRNPLFPNKVTKYELNPEVVDCVVFCSKNYLPILGDITKITSKYNTYFHYTITAYGKDIEPGVPSIEESMDTLIKLSKIVGKQRIAWRYDPVLLTDKYTVNLHLETFERMAKILAPYVDRCIFSFVEMYKKVKENMPEIIPFTETDRETLAKGFGEIARKYGMHIQTCGNSGNYSKFGIHQSGCVTLDIISKANGIKFKNLKHKGIRTGCHCIDSRDIGAYDTCLNGCKYCYANKNPKKAFDNYKYHDVNSPLLLGHIRKTDEISQGKQESYIVKNTAKEQISFFGSNDK